jgi:hypothetical protein
MHAICYNSFFRELHREAIIAWSDQMDLVPKSNTDEMELKLKQIDRRALKASGIKNLEDLTVIKHIKQLGYTFKSKNSQVIIHGKNEKNNFAEILYLLKKKGQDTVFLLVQDLNVTFDKHLGMHVCTRSCSQSLIKFDEMISSCPLNMYRATNHLDEIILYVVAHEALVYK